MKKMISMALVAVMILSIAGCGKEEKSVGFTPKYPADTAFSLAVAGSYENFESLESEFERFYEYYPKADIHYTYLDDYSKTIIRALEGQEPPDIFVMQYWMYGNSSYDTLFEHAEVLSDPALGINLDCIRPGVKWIMDNGDIVTLPIFATSYGMLVNRDIFEKEGLKVPTNFGELKETCDKLKAAGYESPMMGANTTNTSGIYYSFSYPMFTYTVRENLDKQDSLNNLEPSAGELMRPALNRVKDLVDAGCIDLAKCSAEIEDEYNGVIMRFFEGDVPMMFCSGDVVSGTRKRESKSEAFSANPFKYDFYVAPTGDKGGYYLDAISLFFAVNKESANLDMTNEFIRFLASDMELGSMSEKKRLITPTSDYSLDEVYGSLSGFATDQSISFRDTNILNPVVREYLEAAMKVGNGEMTVDEAVAAFGTLAQ